MRPLFISFISLLLCMACEKGPKKDQEETEPQADSTALADTSKMAKFLFVESEFDFGNIKEGDVVKHVFKFTNIGKSELVITDAKGSCGCTIPSYPKEAVPVGGTGEIEVQFNSQNKSGANQKFVSVVANTFPEVTTISIKAVVLKEEESKGPLAN